MNQVESKGCLDENLEKVSCLSDRKAQKWKGGWEQRQYMRTIKTCGKNGTRGSDAKVE